MMLHSTPAPARDRRRLDKAGPAPTAPMITIAGLHRDFGDIHAVGGIDLTIAAGEFTTIVGESGCGKTTLLRLIAGLDTPTAGTVRIEGRDTASIPAAERNIGMVFQQHALYPGKTVRHNIDFPLRMARLDAAERRGRVDMIAQRLHLESLLDRRPTQLSGGQQRRVGIARALARQPKVLLLDEPLSSLDAALRDELRSLLADLHRDTAMTVVHVTHDQSEAMALATQLVLMRSGRLEQQGPPAEVFSNPDTAYAARFLGGMNVIAASSITKNATPACQIRSLDAGCTHIGFRPEHAQIAAAGADDQAGAVSLDAIVERDELLGVDRMVHLITVDQPVRVRQDAAEPVRHGRCRIVVPASAIHVFGGGKPRTQLSINTFEEI